MSPDPRRKAPPERERETIEGIRRALADLEAGRVVSHEEAMAEIDAVIEAAKNAGRPTAR
jgi:predicted transcriptional regulator